MFKSLKRSKSASSAHQKFSKANSSELPTETSAVSQISFHSKSHPDIGCLPPSPDSDADSLQTFSRTNSVSSTGSIAADDEEFAKFLFQYDGEGTVDTLTDHDSLDEDDDVDSESSFPSCAAADILVRRRKLRNAAVFRQWCCQHPGVAKAVLCMTEHVNDFPAMNPRAVTTSLGWMFVGGDVQKAIGLSRFCTEKSMEETQSPAQIFREDNCYVRLVVVVSHLLMRGVLRKCAQKALKISLDFQKYPSIKEDQTTRAKMLSLILSIIVKELQNVSRECRVVFAHINKEVEKKFPRRGFQAVFSLIFLRMLCPSISCPVAYRVLSKEPAPASSKRLLETSKYLQVFVNHCCETTKCDNEPLFVRELWKEKAKLQGIFRALTDEKKGKSKISEAANPRRVQELDRHTRTIHTFLFDYRELLIMFVRDLWPQKANQWLNDFDRTVADAAIPLNRVDLISTSML